jgi:multidrug transporter EmrE-like cation transporter
MIWFVLALAIVANASANILIKAAMREKNFETGGAASLVSAIWSPFMLAGIMMFVVALAGYSLVLSKMNLSVAYPVMTTMGFIVVLTASWLFFGEAITAVQIVGYALMLSGVWLVLR